METPAVIIHERSNGSTHLKSVGQDPLGNFRLELDRQRKRYKPFSIETYIEGVLQGTYPKPPKNAAELVLAALTQNPPRETPAGYPEYPVFSDRQDDLAIVGIPGTIDTYMRFLRTEARLNTKDRMAVVIAPTGAGKSTINRVPIATLESYTHNAQPAPVYGIRDCPINEEPLHILDQETRYQWREEKGIDITGELCPHCQLKAEDSIQKGNLGYQTGSPLPLDFEVQALRFSASLGRGLTKLEPKVFMEPNPNYAVSKAILGSNRGILYISELEEQSPDFLRMLNDLTRGRNYTFQGQIYELDNIIISEMTLPGWDRLKADATNKSLIERMEDITATYPLDPLSEVAILNKRISGSRLTIQPHFSPRVLETAATAAVRTRLVGYPQSILSGQTARKLDEGDKALFYSGNNINGFTQQDRKRIEEDGRSRGEGITGMSPPTLFKIVSSLIGEQISAAELSEAPGCVEVTGLIKRFEDYIKYAPSLTIDERKRVSDQFSAVLEKYNDWLIFTIEKAFEDRYSERANALLKEYLDDAGLLLEKKNKVNSNGVEVEPDRTFVENVENAIYEKPIPHIEAETTRKEFRMDIQLHAGKVRTKSGNDPDVKDFFSKFPNFETGIKLLVTRGLGNAKDIIKALAPTEEQDRKLTEMKNRLVAEHGFCECCAPKMVAYAGNVLRKKG